MLHSFQQVTTDLTMADDQCKSIQSRHQVLVNHPPEVVRSSPDCPSWPMCLLHLQAPLWIAKHLVQLGILYSKYWISHQGLNHIKESHWPSLNI